MTKIIFLTLNQILFINRYFKKQSTKELEVKYKCRFVRINIRKNLFRLPECAKEYYLKTENVILTATYYLKNIIILQSLEDANHRTAIYATRMFLKSNGYKTKKVSSECYLTFKNRLLMWRYKEYYTYDSLDIDELKSNKNTTENYVFNFCFEFIKNKILR